jgi:uncharacterized protein (UPF0335 family)
VYFPNDTKEAKEVISALLADLDTLPKETRIVIMGDMKEVFAEAKGEGFDVKILRKIVRLRKQDRAKRLEEEALIDLYLSAIGGL